MPRRRGKAPDANEVEPVKEAEQEEKVEFDEIEEPMEGEEVEYEEVELVEEVEEEEEEEEVEEDLEEEDEPNVADNQGNGDVNMKDYEKEEDERKTHAELLALPPHGSEIYVGNLSNDASKEDIKSHFESVGEVTEVRILIGKDSTENKGYGFVTFRTKELAAKAIKDLNNSEFKERKIRCSASQAKHRLFIGNIPRNWVEDNLRRAVEKLGPGVSRIDLMKDPQNSGRNRGFAFIEYYNHACAEFSRKKMSNPEFKLDDNAPTVSWADPKSGDSSASQVKAIYVKNLPKTVTQEQLRKLFKHHGEITRVVLPPAKSGQENRYGFVHFSERSAAMKALKNTEKYELDGQVLECSLAKPPADKKNDVATNLQKGPPLASYSPQLGFGVMGSAYGALGAGFSQPMLYGRGAAPGMAMVPMILPDGRLAYVMQQPGTPPAAAQKNAGRGGSSRDGRQGGGGGGGRQGGAGNRGQRFRPY